MTTLFHIGAARWPGISKLRTRVRVRGGPSQVCGKLIGAEGAVHHWDGTNLKERLEEEMGDVLAAIDFVVSRTDLDVGRIATRRRTKLATFQRWHAEQVPLPEQTGQGASS